MSACYGLSHVIRECLDEKARVVTTARGKSSDAKLEIYNNSWQSLNAWIEFKLSKQKGAGISGFGCFCWELKQRDGATHCRPLFILSDPFIKTFRVKQDRIHHPPQTTSIEEVNYSLLAIKYSKKLTKDMVFSGIRDILRKIGDFIHRGYELEIHFNFGTLRAKDRRIKFEFNQARLQQILPEKEPGILAYDTSAMAYFEDDESEQSGNRPEDSTPRPRTVEHELENTTWNQDSASEARRSTTALPPLSLSQTDLPPLRRNHTADASLSSFPSGSRHHQQQQDQQSEQSQDPLIVDTTTFNQTSFSDCGGGHISEERREVFHAMADSDTINETAPSRKSFAEFESEQTLKETLPVDLRNLLNTLAKKQTAESKKEFRQKARERVAEQAYLRCLDCVDDHARLDDNTLHESTTAFNEWRAGLNKQKEDMRMQVQQMKSSLDEQVARNQARAEKEHQDKKNIIMKFILPDNAGMVTGSSLGASIGPDGKVISSRQKINKDLEAQMQRNSEMREKQHNDTLARERDYLRRLALEIELHKAKERSEHLETQKALLEAWERDGHIRNLRKLQPHGRSSVRDYIETNLAETTGAMIVNRPSTSIGGAINRSIGYDPRRGRIMP